MPVIREIPVLPGQLVPLWANGSLTTVRLPPLQQPTPDSTPPSISVLVTPSPTSTPFVGTDDVLSTVEALSFTANLQATSFSQDGLLSNPLPSPSVPDPSASYAQSLTISMSTPTPDPVQSATPAPATMYELSIGSSDSGSSMATAAPTAFSMPGVVISSRTLVPAEFPESANALSVLSSALQTYSQSTMNGVVDASIASTLLADTLTSNQATQIISTVSESATGIPKFSLDLPLTAFGSSSSQQQISLAAAAPKTTSGSGISSGQSPSITINSQISLPLSSESASSGITVSEVSISNDPTAATTTMQLELPSTISETPDISAGSTASQTESVVLSFSLSVTDAATTEESQLPTAITSPTDTLSVATTGTIVSSTDSAQTLPNTSLSPETTITASVSTPSSLRNSASSTSTNSSRPFTTIYSTLVIATQSGLQLIPAATSVATAASSNMKSDAIGSVRAGDPLAALVLLVGLLLGI